MVADRTSPPCLCLWRGLVADRTSPPCLCLWKSIGHGQDVTSLSVFHLEPCLCTNLLSCVCGEYWLQTGRHLLVCVSPRTMSLYKPFVLCLWRVLVTDRTSPPLSVFRLEPCLCTNLLSCVCGGYWSQTGRHLLVCVSPRTVSLYKPFVLCLWRVLVTDRTSPPCLCFHLEPCLCTNLLSCVCGEYWLQTGRHLLVCVCGEYWSQTGRHLLICVSPRTVSLYKPFVLCLWRVLVTDRTSPPCLCFA